jgi:Cu2+-exporting ATPase
MLAAGREEVTVVEAGAQTRRQVREVTTGTLVLVLPGERIAVDGVVLDGCSSVNEAVITGESRPITKAPGSATLAGSMNHDGALLIRSTSAGTATRWAHIARSVREALNQPGRAQRLADRIAGALVPVVLLLAAATVIAWAQWVPFHRALVTGLAVLVVACPCGLGLAGALATSLGIGRLVRQGCLVRGGDIVEALAGVRVVAFDKTGTLTAGATRVIEIETDGTPVEEVLRIAAGLEQASEHPLARAIVAAAEEHGIQPTLAQMVRAVPGCGVHGAMAGAPAAAGSATWLAGLGFRLPGGLAARARRLATSTASLVHVGSGERTIAVLALRDSLRPEAGAAVRQLRELGLRTVLLSGDRVDVAERIAAELGADDCQASLSPEEKRAALLRWRERSGPVAMVGDGLNDGPVLATADVGIAVGTATDLARETAGIVLPDGGLRLLPWVVSVSREVRRTIGTNLLWAFGYNAIGLGLAATGHLRPVAAAVLMAGSSLVVVANSLRLEWFGAQFDAAERDHAAWSDGDISDRSATAPRRARRSAI